MLLKKRGGGREAHLVRDCCCFGKNPPSPSSLPLCEILFHSLVTFTSPFLLRPPTLFAARPSLSPLWVQARHSYTFQRAFLDEKKGRGRKISPFFFPRALPLLRFVLLGRCLGTLISHFSFSQHPPKQNSSPFFGALSLLKG